MLIFVNTLTSHFFGLEYRIFSQILEVVPTSISSRDLKSFSTMVPDNLNTNISDLIIYYVEVLRHLMDWLYYFLYRYLYRFKILHCCISPALQCDHSRPVPNLLRNMVNEVSKLQSDYDISKIVRDGLSSNNVSLVPKIMANVCGVMPLTL